MVHPAVRLEMQFALHSFRQLQNRIIKRSETEHLFFADARNGSMLVIEGPKQVMLSSTWQSSFLAPGEGKFTIPRDREIVGKILTDTSLWIFVCCVFCRLNSLNVCRFCWFELFFHIRLAIWSFYMYIYIYISLCFYV